MTWWSVSNRIYSLVKHENDSDLMQQRKRFTGTLCLLIMMALLPVIAVSVSRGFMLEHMVIITGGVSSAACLALMILTKKLSEKAIALYLACLSSAVCFADVDSASTLSDRAWPLFVLLIDALLVMRMPDFYSKAAVSLVCLWLFIQVGEGLFRFGLYDVPGTASVSDRKEVTDCDTPPCSSHANVLLKTITAQLIVFLIDFYFTRGFAKTVTLEKERLEASIMATEKVTEALVHFDLEKAESVLSTIPESQTTELLRRLLSNLENYRPYLPAAIFEGSSGTTSVPDNEADNEMSKMRTNPPGLISHSAALVFTDIEASTMIWEAIGDKMKTALAAHNTIMRKCIVEANGYEVKTIGDSFMVAFDCAPDAVQFGILAQNALFNYTWDDSLRGIQQCCTRDDVWNGIRVRVGIHCGDVEPDLNPLTSRYDYHGTVVNTAARVEGCGAGGGVFVTQQVHDALPDMLEPNHVTHKIGKLSLKGIASELMVYLLLPDHLAPRLSEVMSKVNEKHNKRTVHSGSESSRRSAAGQPQGNHHSRLQRAVAASCVILSVDGVCLENNGDVGSRLNQLLSTVNSLSEQSQGGVLAVTGTDVTLGWNMQKRCQSHTFESVHYVATLFKVLKRTAASWVSGVSASVGTGSATHGTVGTAKAKYYVTLGKAPQLCVAGLRVCQYMGVQASIVCSMATAAHIATHYLTRPVGVVTVDSELTTVHQLDVAECTDPLSWPWSEEYFDCFHKQDDKGIAMHNEAEDDPTLTSVVRMMRNSNHPTFPL
eukprot:TRINITY_DN1118_c3_g1_i2.p1 TRINITY_DN1118_c3_g1~~TRINITY_DN1118_c3_g1_i2.p1  ORF type:complete len:780 (+),score=86.34 TRINITY_DN1118_c3_g1_i2:29-2341(+)